MPALANVFKKTVLGRLEMFFLKMENNQKILGDLNLSRAALSQWLMQKCKSSALVYNLSVRASLKNKAKIGTYLEIALPPPFFFFFSFCIPLALLFPVLPGAIT